MGSRLENLIRAAVQTFSVRQSGSSSSAVAANFNENIQHLSQLLAEIDPVKDLGLNHPAVTAQPQRKSTLSSLFSPTLPSTNNSPVDYMEIFENSVVSVGIFILKQGVSIPLHDHFGMHGILKVLYGHLQLQAYTPMSSKEHNKRSTSLIAHKHPTILLSGNDGPATLAPLDRNLHQISAVDGPASFLDILAPPYHPDGSGSDHDRDCFYYRDDGIVSSSLRKEDETNVHLLTRISCPSTFWCGSIKFPGPKVAYPK